MATKRMFSKDIVRADKFLDMSLSTQALYFHLCLDADAKGFVTPRSIMRLINATLDDLNVLVSKGFVIPFETGVVIITDWRVHNYIDEEREAPTQYITEFSRISLQPQKNYKLVENSQSTLGEIRVDKSRLDKIRLEGVTQTLELVKYSKRSDLTDAILQEIAERYEVPMDFVEDCWDSAKNWLDSVGTTKKDYRAFLTNWVKRERARFVIEAKKLQKGQNGTRVADLSHL